jgi:siroheme synthase (precorrin-2 oxidase/ferrochelatase)
MSDTRTLTVRRADIAVRSADVRSDEESVVRAFHDIPDAAGDERATHACHKARHLVVAV